MTIPLNEERVITPWEEGFAAGQEGKSLKDNPYSLENDDYELWYRGWATRWFDK